jgi:hypothetical protein
MKADANKSTNTVICSFYTSDQYYKTCADKLRKNLEKIGLDYELSEIVKNEGEAWIDICRKKVGFIADICKKYPDKKVFWIDVDCELFSMPEFILNSTADIIGFQRGFGSPINIGYLVKGRFWEPSFWGINTSIQAREMIIRAANLEKKSTIRATDDYFFEEAWRSTYDNLTFQIIPSNCAINKGSQNAHGHQVFFKFGSSGSVDGNFRKVAQHKPLKQGIRNNIKKNLLSISQRIEKLLPKKFSKRVRKRFDELGITGFLTNKKHFSSSNKLEKKLLKSAKSGDVSKSEVFARKLDDSLPYDNLIQSTIKVSSSFLTYSSKPSKETLRMSWWQFPFPGNYGDWLSPFIFNQYTDSKILYKNPTSRSQSKHIISIGSIGRFIKSNSIVVGTGVSSFDYDLNKSADYVSVRGPITAELVTKIGGPRINKFGDPAIVLSRILPISRAKNNGRILLVRHFAHLQIPIKLENNMDELSILISSPQDIIAFIYSLNEYEKVITSSLHVMITCHSYGIPCALITFEGFEDKISGSGLKYSDYCLGADLPVVEPSLVSFDLKMSDIDKIIHTNQISIVKQNEVENAIQESLLRYKGE